MARSIRVGIATLVLSASLAGVANATGDARPAVEFKAGDHVRMTVASVQEEVVVEEIMADRLVVRSRGVVEPKEVPFSELQYLEIHAARSRTAGAGRGATLGGLVGLVTGFAVGLSSGNDRPCPGDELCLSMRAVDKGPLLGAVGAVAGITLGGIAGCAFPGSEWRPVALPFKIDVGPVEGQPLGLAIGVAF